MKTRLLIGLPCCIFLLACLAWSVPSRVEVRREVYLMGTRVRLLTHAPERDRGVRQLEHLIQILEETEEQLSTWRWDSTISRLNRQPIGVPFALDGSLCRMFGHLQVWADRTGGAFEPAIGTLVEAWGGHTGGRRPSFEQLRRARRNAGFQHFRLDSELCTLVRDGESWIDVGAFGKGEALDRVHDYSLGEGLDPWLIDLGGQIMVHGIPNGDRFWNLALAHPVHREQPVMTLELREGSLATSGGSERDIGSGADRIGHILDPRRGVPIQTDFTVTVWHKRALEADILSTALYVMGVDDGLSWAEENGVAAGFLIPTPDGGAVLRSSSLFENTFVVD